MQGLIKQPIGKGLGLVFVILGLTWIVKLNDKECPCSKSWMREYIKYYLYYAIIISFILPMTIFFYPKIKTNIIFMYIAVFSAILAIANIAISIYYINNLKKEDCKCSEDYKREIYYVWNIIVATLYILLGISLMYYSYVLYKK
jgi:hypothetical protein